MIIWINLLGGENDSQFSAGFPQRCTSASPLSRQGRTKWGSPPGTKWQLGKYILWKKKRGNFEGQNGSLTIERIMSRRRITDQHVEIINQLGLEAAEEARLEHLELKQDVLFRQFGSEKWKASLHLVPHLGGYERDKEKQDCACKWRSWSFITYIDRYEIQCMWAD